MKVSVLVIAHNEEKHIGKCLESLIHQTRQPDEIILLAHNCDDSTTVIAHSFSAVKVISVTTKGEGPLFARIEGFKHVNGDVVACIDGDAVADKNWLQFLIQPFLQSEIIVGVGGYVDFYRAFFANISSFFFFLGGSSIWRPIKPFYFWGANFAVRRESYLHIGGLEPLVELYPKIGLSCPTEDLYLSLVLGKVGSIVYAKHAHVRCFLGDFFSSPERRCDIFGDQRKLIRFFRKSY